MMLSEQVAMHFWPGSGSRTWETSSDDDGRKIAGACRDTRNSSGEKRSENGSCSNLSCILWFQFEFLNLKVQSVSF